MQCDYVIAKLRNTDAQAFEYAYNIILKLLYNYSLELFRIYEVEYHMIISLPYLKNDDRSCSS